MWDRFVNENTSCDRTESCPSAHGSKTEVLTNSKLHIEKRDSIDCQHDKVRYEERGCQENINNMKSPSNLQDIVSRRTFIELQGLVF